MVTTLDRTLMSSNTRACMFCGASLMNRGEAYYDHLGANPGCHSAWLEWTVRLDEDRNAGG